MSCVNFVDIITYEDLKHVVKFWYVKITCLLFVKFFFSLLLLTGFGQSRPTGSKFRSTDLAWKE